MKIVRHTLVLSLLLVACKDKAPAPTPTAGSAASTTSGSGSAAPTGSAATGSAAGSAAAPDPAPAAGSAAPAAAGKVFDGPTFTVTSTLSGPAKKEKEIDTAAGKTTMTMYTFTDPADGNTAQMVESNAVPPTSVSEGKLLYSSMEGMVGDLKATIDNQKTLTVGGITMLDFAAHVSDADGTFFVRGRVAIKASTLYQVVAFGSGQTPTADAEAFVSSFALK